ncbi:unnamed protein product, partial [Rotaria sp. Silwood2]
MEFIVEEGVIKKQCRVLSLFECKITSASVAIIANSLNQENSLQEIRLNHNYIDDDGIYHLANSLSNNTNNVKFLDLTKNKITNVGAKHLAEMIK